MRHTCLSLSAAIVMAGAVVAPAPVIAETAKAPHWSYEGEAGPDHWGELAEAFETCRTGTKQSPIDVKSATRISGSELKIKYANGPKEIVNNGHTIQANIQPGDTLTVDGKTYDLVQFHFHTPSENHIGGRGYPMELHFVNKASDGSLAVVAVMIKEGTANSDLSAIFAKTPKSGATPVSISDRKFDMSELLPANREHFRFSGSLTTPPCTEGVTWLVMAHPITASKAEIGKFKTFYPHNARPLQSSTGRQITEYSK